MNINSECPVCNKEGKTIDHIIINCDLAFNVWVTIHTKCPTLINASYMIIG